MSKTGDWPPMWGAKDVEQSPYSACEINRALKWLKTAYPPKVAKRVFAHREQPLLALLSDVSALWLSELVSLGLDGALVRPPKALVDRLRNAHEYFGAWNELALMAGLQAADIPFVFDPLAKETSKSPDFLVPTLGEGLFLEAKYCGPGSCVREAVELANKISCKDRYLELWTHRHTEVVFTDRLRSLLSIPSGVRQLRKIADELRTKVLDVLLAARLDNESHEVLVDDLVRVRVGERVESGFMGSLDGVLPDPDFEAERIVKTYLQKGASQLPSDRHGVVMIDIDNSLNASRVHQVISAWLDHPEQGGLYKGCIGAILVYGYWPAEPYVRFLQVDPIWKYDVPLEYRDRRFWDRFQGGLNWQRILTWDWVRQRREEQRSTDSRRNLTPLVRTSAASTSLNSSEVGRRLALARRGEAR